MFQKMIFIFLIVGLGFFLYLLKTGEISQDAFSIKNFQKPVHFEIKQQANTDDFGNTIFDIKLVVKNVEYTIYSFSKTEFKKLGITEYSEKKYQIPNYAKDAVSGNWLGTRYTFYVTEENNETGTMYRVYRATQAYDSLQEPSYSVIKEISLNKKKNTGSDAPLY